MFTFLKLKPLIWHQEIRHFPGNLGIGDDEGGYLTATCVPDAKCDLLLSNGAKLTDFKITLSFLRGEIGADMRLKSRLLKDAIGGVWFNEEYESVYGWFYLKSNNYTALWDQVRDGGYVDCVISLQVDSGKDDETWDGKALSIGTVSVTFARKPILDPNADQRVSREKGLFAPR